ncbi:hypothetical protein EDD21DRAFT_357139 [Dissophora ornata]|nr:hypothetical protein BGZ58_009466 [Dissophora ornata]KAI8597579.1 hypothetical protein EDD21DRAFT_357139 [Dissophora ornata]
MSNPLLDLSSKDELISSLLSGNKSSTPKETPIGERKTFKVQSDLLARLEDFLPKMKEANAQLDQKLQEDPKALDIENVDEESGEQYIEMDLGLGVFDLKKDVKEEDIVINPSDIKSDKPAVKPAIVMMDVDKSNESDDHGDSDEDSEGSVKKQQIPANKSTKNSSVTEGEDIVMLP